MILKIFYSPPRLFCPELGSSLPTLTRVREKSPLPQIWNVAHSDILNHVWPDNIRFDVRWARLLAGKAPKRDHRIRARGFCDIWSEVIGFFSRCARL